MFKVIDVMKDKVATVALSTPVIEVAHRMRISGLTLIPVCSSGKFRGVVTAQDIVARLVAEGNDPVTAKAVSVINSKYPLISPDADVTEAARIMADNNIQVLPVVQNNKLLGLVNLQDCNMNLRY